MWISMASLAIPIALVALSGVLATLACHRSLTEAGARFHASVWRTWGRVGALTSLAFYLLEYFPSHLGWRLEINHPLYALAWWSGAELTACLLEYLTAEPEYRTATGYKLGRCAAWALPVALAPALVIFVRGAAVFAPLDPLMVRLHRTIIEFMPLMVRLQSDGLATHFEYVFLFPVLYVWAVLLLTFADRPARHAVWSMFTPIVALVALGFVQSRWALSAGSAEIPLLLACLAIAFTKPFFGATARRRGLTAAFAVSFLYLPGMTVVLRSQFQNWRDHVVPADEILALTHREIAQAIRESQPTGPVVVFTSPNTSLALGYYGRFQTLGTLYWENGTGLKAAAELNSAATDEEAETIIRRLGVTHIVMITQDNYVLEYAQLLHPDFSNAALQSTFGFRLLGKKVIPQWLEPVMYRTPRNLPGKLAGLEAYVFKVNFSQTPAEGLYRIGQLLALQENDNASLDSFAWAAQHSDKDAAPWLRRGEIFLRQKNWRDAAENFDRGIDISPASERYKLLTQAGIAFEQGGEIATAISYYRRAVTEPMTNAVALNNLAWRLATARQDDLRDPARALQHAQTAVAREPADAGNLDTLAGALAANGRFAEAIAAAERAIKLAEKAGDKDTAAAARLHLAAYRAHQPWRE